MNDRLGAFTLRAGDGRFSDQYKEQLKTAVQVGTDFVCVAVVGALCSPRVQGGVLWASDAADVRLV